MEGANRKEGEGSSRNMYKGPMDKPKGGRIEGGVGSVGTQLYLNNNKKLK